MASASAIPAQPGQQDAQLVVDLEVVRPNLEDLAKGRDGLLVLVLPRAQIAEALGRLGEIGRGPSAASNAAAASSNLIRRR